MEEKTVVERKRGGCLTAYIIFLLIIFSLGVLIGLMLLALSSIPEFSQETDMTAIDALLIIIPYSMGIVGCILILKWKKLGVHLIVIVYVLDLFYAIYDFSVNGPSDIPGSQGGSVTGLIIFYFLIRKAYRHMT